MEVCLRVGVVHRRRALWAGESSYRVRDTAPRRPLGQRIRWQPVWLARRSVLARLLGPGPVRDATSRALKGSTTTTVRAIRPRSLRSRSVVGDRERPHRGISFAYRGGRREGYQGVRGNRRKTCAPPSSRPALEHRHWRSGRRRRLAPRRPCYASYYVVLAAASTLATVTVSASVAPHSWRNASGGRVAVSGCTNGEGGQGRARRSLSLVGTHELTKGE